jgi:DNA helicase-2/ATP-dependent DNA helicase PcrA
MARLRSALRLRHDDACEQPSASNGVPVLGEDYLNLSTIHSAKGMDLRFPFQRSRWLPPLRSCHRLRPGNRGGTSPPPCRHDQRQEPSPSAGSTALFHARGMGDRHVYALCTRFIPNAMLLHFESRSWPAPNTASSSVNGLTRKVDVRAKMRQMWG